MSLKLRHGVALAALAFASLPAHAIALIGGLGGPAGYGELSQFPNDDGSSPELNLGFSLNFFGQSYDTLYVNNNGNVTFGGPNSAFTPNEFGSGSATPYPMIAPFWADVDTRAPNGGGVYYSSTRDRFIATWNNVGYYSYRDDKLNDFQLVLINRADTGAGNFDIEFRYNKIEWVSGSASGGVDGFGGTPAQAGYDATPFGGGSGYGDNGYGDNGYGGEGGVDASSVFTLASLVATPGDEEAEATGPGSSVATFFSLPDSFTNDMANIENTSNTGIDGLWKFQIRNGSIADGSTPEAPLDPTEFIDGGFSFDLEVDQPDIPIFIDPPVATAYRYTVSGTTDGGDDFAFTSVLFSSDVGDDSYLLFDSSGNALNDASGSNRVTVGTRFFFTTPISDFTVREIAPSLLLDINSPTFATAFVTGLTFNGRGDATVTQTVVSTVDLPNGSAVPEPTSWALMILGLGLVGMAARRRKPVPAIA